MLRRTALLLLLLFIPQAASGQIFLSGGAAAPLSPDPVTDIYRSGYSVALGFILESGAYPFVRLRPFGSFQKFRTDPGPFRNQFENFDEVEGGAMPVIFAGADLQFRRPFADFTPFVAPALGLAVFSIDDITADGITINLQDERTGLAVGIGGGFAYRLTRNYGLFLEAQAVYTILDGADRTFVPVRFGVELSFDA
jgi:hypothetical protein